MSSSQIRLNITTGEWVMYAPSRRDRPRDFPTNPPEKSPSVDYQATCPFCPGHEERINPIILELPHPHQSGWQTRVIPNKYPVLTSIESPHRQQSGIHLTMPGYGYHEVVIESSNHQQTIATMSVAQVETIIETYHRRYLKLMEDPQIMLVIIFRNHGRAAGASLVHPHSQIVATSFVPHYRRQQEAEAQHYYDLWGRCVYCDLLRVEQQQRVIAENEAFLAFVPFAAEVPYEVWIMPKQHQADFGSITETEKTAFAEVLHDVLARLYYHLDNPDYNYAISTAARYKAEEPQLHWYCQIKPRLTTPAGFEMGSGMSVNPSIPEDDAALLRKDTLLKVRSDLQL